MELNEFSRSSLAQAINLHGRQLSSVHRALEKRVLLDASVAVDASQSASHVAADGGDDAIAAIAEKNSDQKTQSDSDADGNKSFAELLAPESEHHQELVVIDLQLNGAQELVDDLIGRASSITENADSLQLTIGERSITLLALDIDDGLNTVTDFINDSGQTFDAVHLVSHGGPGGIDVGGDKLSLTSLVETAQNNHRAQLQSWGDNLSADADILFYGCNTGYSLTGEKFITQVANLTGADVAASDDATGSALRGGDWELEKHRGNVETDIVFSQLLQGSWEGLMVATPTVTADVPAEDFINEPTDMGFSFENDGDTEGYGPFVDIVVGPGAEVQSVTGLLGASVETYTVVDGQWVDSSGNPVEYHPYDVNQTDAIPLPPVGPEGSTWYAIELPFGSFTPGQPAYEFTASVLLDEAAGAVVGVPIPIWIRPGFMFGNDPLNNPDTDPPVVADPIETSITPTVMEVEKVALDGDGDNASIGDDGETVTGPSEPVTWQVTVDIANLSPVENLVVTEEVPPNFYYVPGNVTVTDSAGNTLVEGTDYTVTEPPVGANNDAELVVTFLNPVEGTLSDSDIVITYTGYVPDVDADGNPIVINDAANDAVTNTASASATYQDQDIVDSDDETIIATPIAVQKDVAIVEDNGTEGNTPADVLEYTLTVQVSDYMSMEDVVLNDLLGDGLEFDPDSVTIELFINGTSVGPVAMGAGNISFTENPAPGDGTTEIAFDLSQELIDRGLSDGSLDGDLFADGVTDGTTTIVVTFEATIRENYIGAPRAPSAVDALDVVGNTATINANAASANGEAVDNSSSEEIVIEGADSSKSVYAVNGVVGATNEITVGDEVTFAITVDLGTLDTNGVSITDYLPLPVFEAVAPTYTDTGEGASVPGANQWGFGPGTDFENWPDGYLDGDNVTTSANATENSITWTAIPVEQVNSQGGTVQLLFTVVVQDEAFTDGLQLTNVASVTVNGSETDSTLDPDGTQVIIQSPVLSVTKGVVSTDNPNGELDPTTAGPVTFDEAGTAADGSAPWTGDITSQNLDTTPIDSDLSNVDAGDTVRFAIAVENTGGSDAFNVAISDTLPDGFVIPPDGINLQVFTGDGTPVSFTGDLFSGGITLVDPSADEGALNEGHDPDAGDTTDGSNVIIITYDLVASDEVQPNQQITNTATLEAYGGVDGGNDYTEGNSNINWQDDALVEIAANSIEKTLVGTSITSDTNAALDEAVIGEVITYSVTLTIAEGVTPFASVVDTLDPGLAFIGVTGVTFSTGIESTVDLNAIAGEVNGQQVTFTLGDLTNANRDNGVAETITITYEVLVADVAENQSGDQVNNSAEFIWDDTMDQAENPTGQATDSADPVTIIEPDLQVDKTLINTPQPIDAGDPIEYQIVLSHTGSSDTDAFDLTFTDALPSDVTFTPGPLPAGSVIHSTQGDISNLFEITADGSTLQTVAGATFDLLLGETVTIQVSGTVNAGIGAETPISNTATVDWTSINGDDPNERTGAGGVDDYTASDTFTFDSSPVEGFGKFIVSSSVIEANNGRTQATIGETVTYAVAFQVPEGIQTDALIIDTLDTGLEFISLDRVIPSGDLLLDLNGDGEFGEGPADDPSNVTAVVDGDTVTFDLGDIENGAGGGANANTLILVYTVRVENIATNQVGEPGDPFLLRNSAVFSFTDAEGPVVSDPVITEVIVVEPDVSITKGLDPTTADNGDEVTYTIDIANAPTASTANDLTFSDPLPTELTDISFTVILDQDGTQTDISEQFEIVGGVLQTKATADIDLLPGGTISIEVTGTLSGTIAGSTISNTATVDWTSLDGDDPNERNGDDGEGGALDDYEASAEVDLTVVAPQFEKTLVETSQNDGVEGDGYNDNDEVVIGEIATFQLTITLPEATLSGGITDFYGPGFEFVDVVSVTASNPDAISINFDDISAFNDVDNNTLVLLFNNLVNTDTDNTTAETITITYRLRVTDIVENQNGVVLPNEATFVYDNTGDGEPDAETELNASAEVTVVEPVLNIEKELLSPTPLTLGGIAQYQITVTLDETSTAYAYDVNIRDFLPTYLAGVENVQIEVVGSDAQVQNNSAANQLDLNVDFIDENTQIIITIDARVTSDPAAVGEEVTNTTTVEWTSIDGEDPGERTGLDGEGGELDDYETGADVLATITAFDLFIDKDDGGIDETNPAEPGDTVIYTIDYGNRGPAVATNVVITETLPEYATFDAANSTAGWVDNGDGTYSIDIGDLAVEETGTVTFAVTLDNPMPAGVEETNNTVTIESEDGSDPTPDDNEDTDNTPIEAAPDYVIEKVENFDDPAHPGDPISWTITVTNEGNQDGTGVVVTDTLPDTSLFNSFVASNGGVIDLAAGTVTWNIGDMAVGDVVTLTLSAVVNEEVPETIPTQTNSVVVDDDGTNGDDPTPENNEDDEDFDIQYVNLAIDKDDGGIDADNPAEPGDTVTYTLNYANNGTADATGVVITETLPDYVEFDPAANPGWTLDGDTLTYNVGTVAAGASGSVSFTVTIVDPLPAGVEETTNSASIADDGDHGPDQDPDDNNDNDNTPIEAAPDYVIEKVENFEDPAHPGDPIQWTITVTNEGNQDGTGVVVTDTLPDTSLFNSFVASNGGVIDLAAGTVTWNIGDMAVGDVVTLTLSAVVNEEVPDTIPTQTNTVDVDDDHNNGNDPTPDNNHHEIDFDITYVDLAIDKDDGGIDETNPAEPGDTVVYTLNYANNGTADATGVVITETLPEYATFDAANSTAGWVDNGDGTFSIDVGTVAAGATGSVEFAVTIVDPLPAGVEETANSASIEDDGDHGPDHDPDDNNDNDNTPIDGRPDYVAIKTNDFESPVQPGDPVSWTITVTNEGNQDGTGVVVTDTLPDTSLFHDFVASNGGVIDLAAGTVTWNIGDLAAGDSVTLTVSAVVNDTVPETVPAQTNSVDVTDDGTNGPDPTPDNNNDNTDFDITYVDYVVDKIENFEDPTHPGDPISWTIEVRNDGTQDGTGVVVTDTLPDTRLFTDFVASNGGVIDLDAGTVTWNIGDLAAGESVTLTLSAVVAESIPVDIAPQTNTVVVDDDGENGRDRVPDNNDDNEEFTVEFVDLFIDKDDNDAVPRPTDTLVYTIDYGNRGNATSTGVVITETLPPNTSFNAGSSSPGWVDNGDGTFSYAVGTLAPGETGSITFAVTVDYPLDVEIQQTENTATITDDGDHGPDQNPDDNTDTDETDIQNDVNVDNITLSQLHGDYIYPPREWEREAPQLHGRLISKETENVTANLQGGRNGGHFDPAFGTTDGNRFPNDWSRVFRNDFSIDTSADDNAAKSSPLAMDKDVGRYRANSIFGQFERPAASPELPAGATDSAPTLEPDPAPFQSSPAGQEPINLNMERSQLQQQLDEIAREMNESHVSPLLLALAKLSAEETQSAEEKQNSVTD